MSLVGSFGEMHNHRANTLTVKIVIAVLRFSLHVLIYMYIS